MMRYGVLMTASSNEGVKTILVPVSDIEKAKALYSALLGGPPQHDASYYVGYDTEGLHVGLVPGGGPQGMTNLVPYWHVSDIESKIAKMTAAGGRVKEAVRDVGGGRRVATITDADGNELGLSQDS
jgi:predicted enzyme related to lactoylglutathione lyase